MTTLAGPLAATLTAESAALLGEIARIAGDDASAAQAQALHARSLPLAEADASAHDAAIRRLEHPAGDDFELGRALARSVEVLLQIADAAADVAELAADVAERCRDSSRPDAVGVAMMATAAAQTALHLVESNLTVTADSEHSRHARAAALAASASLDRCLDPRPA